MQVLNVKLFVRVGDEPPAITSYAGRASLRGWVTAVAKRSALNLKRGKADQAHAELASGIQQLASAAGPELALLKARYKAEFEESIRIGLAAVSEKERSLPLLLHLIHGLTLLQLAAMQEACRARRSR